MILLLTYVLTCVLSPLPSSPVYATTVGTTEMLTVDLGTRNYCIPLDPVVPWDHQFDLNLQAERPEQDPRR